MAATFSKAKTYVFARLKIREREVGGSNPLAPTIYFQHLRPQRSAAGCHLWPICGHFSKNPLLSLVDALECKAPWSSFLGVPDGLDRESIAAC